MKLVDCQDIYQDGKQYDLINRSFIEDIPFYLRQIQKYNTPVLEIACGTGRITLPIAEKGYSITGLDVSNGMLDHAKKKARAKNLHIEWILSDCRNFNLSQKFNIIIYPFNAMAHLHDLESLEACLTCIKKHLNPNGVFIVDIFNPKLEILIRDATWNYLVEEYIDPDTNELVVIMENNVYESDSQINRIKWYLNFGNKKETAVDLNMRMWFPQEIDALLHYNGFRIEAKYGNYDESAFGSSSPKQIIISKKI
jgi:SAM-dependent methyltransferase